MGIIILYFPVGLKKKNQNIKGFGISSSIFTKWITLREHNSLQGKRNICYTSFWDKLLNNHMFQVSDSFLNKAQKDCCFQKVLVLSCKIVRCVVQMEAESRTKFTQTLGYSHSINKTRCYFNTINLAYCCGDFELQLASTSSLLLKLNSATSSF